MSTRGGKKGRGRGRKPKPEAEPDDDFDFLYDTTSAQTFNVQEKLANYPAYSQYFVKELKGEELNLEYVQRHGFNIPLFIAEKTGLGMTVPQGPNFTVTDVKNLVGARRILDVMDCTTQTNSEMTMKEWEEYYNGNDKSRKLNVISLEFSCTKLEPYVAPPRIVRQIDWTENIWPRHFKDMQIESTNDMRAMKYPKVQRYCLMSIGGCYTDFHVDFGGTSVWYHIVNGKKVFWIIPPTEENLKAYENWTLSGKQGDVFFGDLVDKCGMITLNPGNTFLIPSGWIHAVYTPEDSLVFGGNFLHSFSIEKQIRVAQIEEATKVPQKFRFPFFTELQWYALDKYAYALLGRTHLNLEDAVKDKLLGNEEERKNHLKNIENNRPSITPQELFGLKAIVMFIHALAVTKKNIPSLLGEPINLVKDVREIVHMHSDDDFEKSITGKSLLFWEGYKNEEILTPKSKKKNQNKKSPGVTKIIYKKQERVACNICQACISENCEKCENCNCLDKKKVCLLRTCLQPLLRKGLTCIICGLDGWYAEPSTKLIDRPPGTCALMECAACFEPTHPTCVTDNGVKGAVNMDCPNSWDCPKCVKNKNLKRNNNGSNPDTTPTKVLKQETGVGSDANFTGYQLFSVKSTSDQSKTTMRNQLADQILSASTIQAKEPSYVLRPPPITKTAEEIYEKRKKNHLDLLTESCIMLPIFQKLTTAELSICCLVCRGWNRIIQDPSLWYSVKLQNMKISSHLLSLIVQRQPTKLVLDFCTISKQQLTWLLPRIPQTKTLSVKGVDYPSAVVALNTVNAPMIQELDLSYVTNFNDSSLYKILSSPKDSRPGLLDKKSRQKLLRKISLSGTEITDVSLRYLTQFLGQLNCLNINNCWKISDAGLNQLSLSDSKLAETLVSVDVSGCKSVTNHGLASLVKCKNLTRVNCTNTSVTAEGMKKFIEEKKDSVKLKIYGSWIIDRKIK